MPEKQKLKGGKACLAHSLEETRSVVWGGHGGGEGIGRSHCVNSQEAES